MRGYYGRYYGYGQGQGFGPGYGRGWHQNWRGQVQPPEGFTYLGPCRCGFGPNAYWQERETGRIFRGFPGYRSWIRPGYAGPEKEPADEDLRSELNWLKQEKEELEETLKKKYKEEEEKEKNK